MIAIRKSPDTAEKLATLSRDSRYDLACACATRADEHRRRSPDDTWIYPVIHPDGRATFLFKVLLSNECVNRCAYCPLRAGADIARCTLAPEELARAFLSYYRAGRVSGLFLSSAVRGSPDDTMERINRVAVSLRRARFRGYIHLKIIPGASDAAIEQALGLATAVSLNIETAGEANFRRLDTGKEYLRDIVRPMRLIGALTAKGRRYAGVKQTTQFVVGAAQETDAELIRYTWRLYKGLGLARVYFSAYQRAAGSAALSPVRGNRDLLMREHRLYQADWLIRKYGFAVDEIPLGPDGNLSLEADPKEIWARAHPEFFPVAVNRDDAARLLRVPGIGQVAAKRILALRRDGTSFRSPEDLARAVVLRGKAVPYLSF